MIPAAELLIARHGEAHCNQQQIIGGITGCSGLTDRGRCQVERLAQRLAHQHPDRPIHAIYTSPLRRAHESAVMIGACLGVDPHVEPGLAEQHHGEADGQPWTEVVAAYGGIPALDPDRPLVPGGETRVGYLKRADMALGAILARHHGKRVLLVGHGETVDAAFYHFLNLPTPRSATAGIDTYYAALTIWRQRPLSWARPEAGLRWVLTAHNDTSHLIPHKASTSVVADQTGLVSPSQGQ